MSEFLYNVIKWSEVWALFIPLTIIVFYKIRVAEMRPVIIYIWIALILNTISLTLGVFHHHMPKWLPNNLVLYNIHIFLRVVLFSWFITNTRLLKYKKVYLAIVPVYILLVIANFVFLESPLEFSSNLASTENIIILTLCISFFLYSIKDDSETIWMDQPSFLVCTAISLYEALSFFVFLFYDHISEKYPDFGYTTMQIFSISFILFCVLLGIALFRKKEQPEEKKFSLTSKPSS